MESALLFGLIAAALLVAALVFVLPPLLRARIRGKDLSRAEVVEELFRREVDELQQEAALDELPPEEFSAARARARERLLDARQLTTGAPTSTRRARIAALVVGLALPVLAVAIYLAVGRPGALMPPADEATAGDYVARLQAHLDRQPRDARGWVLLARARAEQNDFSAAVIAYEKATAASSKVARDPAVLCEFADVLGMSQGGRLDGRPAELIAQALAIDPKHPVALEMAGSAAYADGRYADAVGHWKSLLAQLAPDSQRHVELAAAIERAQRRAAVSLPR